MDTSSLLIVTVTVPAAGHLDRPSGGFFCFDFACRENESESDCVVSGREDDRDHDCSVPQSARARPVLLGRADRDHGCPAHHTGHDHVVEVRVEACFCSGIHRVRRTDRPTPMR